MNQKTDDLGRLLRWGLREVEDELLELLGAAGFEDIRPHHNAVLRVLDEDGTRPSVLAERAGLTRQAMTQLVDDLERLGYLTRRDDPSDRRAKLVIYTERGRAALATARRSIRKIESRHVRKIGRERFDSMRAALQELFGSSS
jgi:DNA-binding MarR family transcriptional regulator